MNGLSSQAPAKKINRLRQREVNINWPRGSLQRPQTELAMSRPFTTPRWSLPAEGSVANGGCQASERITPWSVSFSPDPRFCVPMLANGNQWKSMKIYENRCKINENQWKSIRTNRTNKNQWNQWESLKIDENRSKSMKIVKINENL